MKGDSGIVRGMGKRQALAVVCTNSADKTAKIAAY
jgi:hypothetical protein